MRIAKKISWPLVLIFGFFNPAIKGDRLAELRTEYQNLRLESRDMTILSAEELIPRQQDRLRLADRKNVVANRMNQLPDEIRDIKKARQQAAQRGKLKRMIGVPKIAHKLRPEAQVVDDDEPITPPSTDMTLDAHSGIAALAPIESTRGISDLPPLASYAMLVKTIAEHKKIEVVVDNAIEQEGFKTIPLTPEQLEKLKGVDCAVEPIKALRLHYATTFTKAKSQEVIAFALPLITCSNNSKNVGIAIDTAIQALKRGSLITIRFVIPEDGADVDELYQLCADKLGLLAIKRRVGG